MGQRGPAPLPRAAKHARGALQPNTRGNPAYWGHGSGIDRGPNPRFQFRRRGGTLPGREGFTMQGQLVATLCSMAVIAIACGGEEPAASQDAAPQIEATPISGRYEVDGATVAIKSGYKRAISGIVLLATQGDRYTATFDLATTLPDPAGEEPILVPIGTVDFGSLDFCGRLIRDYAIILQEKELREVFQKHILDRLPKPVPISYCSVSQL